MTSYQKASWMLKRLEDMPVKDTIALNLINRIKIRNAEGKKMTKYQAQKISKVYNEIIERMSQ